MIKLKLNLIASWASLQTFPGFLPVSDDHHLIRLDDLLPETIHKLQIIPFANLLHCIEKDFVIRLGQDHTREQIRDDAFKQRDVVGQELG